MNGRGADGIGGPIQEFWTARDIVGRVGVLGMVEGTQLIRHGRGRVGRAASMDSEMGQHVGVSNLQPRCGFGRRDAREGLALVEARAAGARA